MIKRFKNKNITQFVFIFVLFSKFFLLSLFYDEKNNIIEKAEREIEKIKPFQKYFNLDTVKIDLKYLANKYKYLLDKEKTISNDCPIWMMWYQGIENAPSIVLSCIQSVIEHKGKHPLIIISKYNLEKYLHLPSYIIEKFSNKTFSITHFSDIIRMGLLSKYGGYWIDSTYLITSTLKRIKSSFYTLKLNRCWPHKFIKCLWSGNFLAVGKNSFIATYAYISFLLYWKKYNSLVNYFLIDFIIHIAYHHVSKFKKIITKLPFVTCNIFSLYRKLNSTYNEFDICTFNKLNKRYKKTTKNINLTNYDYIINHYKFDLKQINQNEIKK